MKSQKLYFAELFTAILLLGLGTFEMTIDLENTTKLFKKLCRPSCLNVSEAILQRHLLRTKWMLLQHRQIQFEAGVRNRRHVKSEK